jgi:hypothetical protein
MTGSGDNVSSSASGRRSPNIDQIRQQPLVAGVARGASDAEEAEPDDVSGLGIEMGADWIVGMADRRRRGHRLVQEDVDVTGEADGCGGRTCGLMTTRDFGECRAVSNDGE